MCVRYGLWTRWIIIALQGSGQTKPCCRRPAPFSPARAPHVPVKVSGGFPSVGWIAWSVGRAHDPLNAMGSVSSVRRWVVFLLLEEGWCLLCEKMGGVSSVRRWVVFPMLKDG